MGGAAGPSGSRGSRQRHLLAMGAQAIERRAIILQGQAR